MTRSILLALSLLACSLCRADEPREPAIAWVSRAVLLTSTVDGERAPIVMLIAQNPRLRTPAMLDLLAEELWTIRAQKRTEWETGSQIIRALAGAPDAARYYDVLSGVGKYFTSNGALKTLESFKANHRRKDAAQYVPGAVDLDALRRALDAAALARQPTEAEAQALATMPADATFDQVFALAGEPALVVNRENRMSEVAPVEIRRMWLYYRGIGRVAFEYQRDVGWHQIQFIADPMAFELLMPYRAANAASLPDDASIAMIQLLTGNSSSIKASAMAMYRRDNVPLEYLDTAAELLLTRHADAARAGASDAYAWLCNVLAHHGGPRYAQVLATVERETTDPKLRKFAAQPLDKTQLEERVPYVPGSVSLAEKAQRYPSLYPQVALVRGQL